MTLATVIASTFTFAGYAQPLPAPGSVRINEVIIDSRGSNTSEKEYVEIYSATPNQPLANLSIVTVVGIEVPSENLQPGAIIRRWDMDATSRTNEQGFFLIANDLTAQSYNVTPDISFGYEDRLTNEPQTIVLMATSAAPAVGENIRNRSIQPNDIFDAVGLTDDKGDAVHFFNAPVLGPDQVFLAAGATRVKDGVHTGDISDWALADIEAAPDPTYNTPGGPNRIGANAVVSDAQNVAVDTSVTTAPPQWNLYDPQAVDLAIREQGSALVYVRSKNFPGCLDFENRYLLHPVAQPLLADRPTFYMDVTDSGYGRLASELGVYRVPSLAFRNQNGGWEYLNARPETTGREIYEFLLKR